MTVRNRHVYVSLVFPWFSWLPRLRSQGSSQPRSQDHSVWFKKWRNSGSLWHNVPLPRTRFAAPWATWPTAGDSNHPSRICSVGVNSGPFPLFEGKMTKKVKLLYFATGSCAECVKSWSYPHHSLLCYTGCCSGRTSRFWWGEEEYHCEGRPAKVKETLDEHGLFLWIHGLTNFWAKEYAPLLLEGVSSSALIHFSSLEAPKWAHVYFSPLSVDCRPIGRPTYRSTVDRLPADSRPTVGRPIGRPSTDYLPTVGRPIGRQSTDSWVTVGRLLVDSRSTYRPTVGRHAVSRLSVDGRSTVDWLSASGLSSEILQYHLKNETGPRFPGGAGPNTRLHGIWVKTCSNVSLKSTESTSPTLFWETAGRHCRTISCLNLENIPAISEIKRWHRCRVVVFRPTASFPVFATQVGKPIEI